MRADAGRVPERVALLPDLSVEPERGGARVERRARTSWGSSPRVRTKTVCLSVSSLPRLQVPGPDVRAHTRVAPTGMDKHQRRLSLHQLSLTHCVPETTCPARGPCVCACAEHCNVLASCLGTPAPCVPEKARPVTNPNPPTLPSCRNPKRVASEALRAAY